VRHLIGRFGDPAALRCCYEAGLCGFGLHRLLSSMGVACDVVAPSLIPRRDG
jgi:transposase